MVGKDCSLVIGVIGVPPPSLPVTVLENKRNWFIHSSVTVAVYCKVNCVLASVKLSAGANCDNSNTANQWNYQLKVEARYWRT